MHNLTKLDVILFIVKMHNFSGLNSIVRQEVQFYFSVIVDFYHICVIIYMWQETEDVDVFPKLNRFSINMLRPDRFGGVERKG